MNLLPSFPILSLICNDSLGNKREDYQNYSVRCDCQDHSVQCPLMSIVVTSELGSVRLRLRFVFYVSVLYVFFLTIPTVCRAG